MSGTIIIYRRKTLLDIAMIVGIVFFTVETINVMEKRIGIMIMIMEQF